MRHGAPPAAQSLIGWAHLFTGRPWDSETRQYYYRYRWYDPHACRWLSLDPIGYAGGLVQYAYCGGNPVNLVDPWGLSRLSDASDWWDEALGINTALDFYTDHRRNPYVGFVGYYAVGVPAYFTNIGRVGKGFSAAASGYDESGRKLSGCDRGLAGITDASYFLPPLALLLKGKAGVAPAKPTCPTENVKSAESPGSSGLPEFPVPGSALTDGGSCTKVVLLDPIKHPESVGHLEDAGVLGRELTVNREGASARRWAALRGIDTARGMDRDEAPPAVLRADGDPVSVRPIPFRDNRGSGSMIGQQRRGVPNGSKSILDTIRKPGPDE